MATMLPGLNGSTGAEARTAGAKPMATPSATAHNPGGKRSLTRPLSDSQDG